jgi:peptidoglycan/LPS O-acetylase OafA/YrhL
MQERLVFLDLVRVAAALGVLLHHALHGSALQPALAHILPVAIWTFDGAIGFRVPTLFLLSGFFAAYAIHKTDYSGGAIATLLVRRQARLVFAYWAMIAIGLLLIAIIPHKVPVPFPRFSDIIAHLFYLQGVLPDSQIIVGVAWTLCIDVQFYLVFAFIFFAIPRLLNKAARPEDCRSICYLFIAAAGVTTMLIARQGNDESGNRWILDYFHFFACGALICYALFEGGHCRWFWSYALLMLAIGLCDNNRPFYGTAGVALAIGGAAWAGQLTRWGASPFVNYLSSRSYSLYLIHLPIVWNIENLGFKLTGGNRPAALAWFLSGLALSLICTHYYYAWIERPGIRIVQRMRQRSRAAISTAQQPPIGALPA